MPRKARDGRDCGSERGSPREEAQVLMDGISMESRSLGVGSPVCMVGGAWHDDCGSSTAFCPGVSGKPMARTPVTPPARGCACLQPGWALQGVFVDSTRPLRLLAFLHTGQPVHLLLFLCSQSHVFVSIPTTLQ